MNFFSNKSLAQKLERTEARANMEFVNSHLKMIPESLVEWIDINGTYAMFDGSESPLTQTFGLGLFNKLSESDLDIIENFYKQFSVPVFHEVSPMADPGHLDILIKRGYQPIEMTSVLYKQLSKEDVESNRIDSKVIARKSYDNEKNVWAEICAEGWCGEMPDFKDYMYQFAQISLNSNGASSFFTMLNKKPISTGLVYIYDDVALLAGDSTIQEGRNQGGQSALIEARLGYAVEKGCSMAMIAASPGSQSQKNAEKNGFRIAYTRTKWKLSS